MTLAHQQKCLLYERTLSVLFRYVTLEVNDGLSRIGVRVDGDLFVLATSFAGTVELYYDLSTSTYWNRLTWPLRYSTAAATLSVADDERLVTVVLEAVGVRDFFSFDDVAEVVSGLRELHYRGRARRYGCLNGVIGCVGDIIGGTSNSSGRIFYGLTGIFAHIGATIFVAAGQQCAGCNGYNTEANDLDHNVVS